MAKGREIKRRIKSISSMLQVTKAMELISSIKMRKAQEAAMRSRRYAFDSWKIVLKVSAHDKSFQKNYVKERQGRTLALVITSSKGLAGSYNSDVFKKVIEVTEKYGQENIDFITMGDKGARFIRKFGGNIVADFPLGQEIFFSRYSPIVYFAWKSFISGEYARFITVHTHFESISKIAATSLQILPLDVQRLNDFGEGEDEKGPEYTMEPEAEELSRAIVRQIVRALTYQIILESNAAEHASRMVAMKNASDAAKDLKDDFEFTFNQLRQASITQELAEISTGANAIEQ